MLKANSVEVKTPRMSLDHVYADLLATVLNANWIVTAAHCVNG